MSKLLKQILKKSRNSKTRILFPETFDDRTLLALKTILAKKLCQPVLIGEKTIIESSLKKLKLRINLKRCQIISRRDKQLQKDLSQKLFKLRQKKGLTLKQAEELIKNDLNYFANTCLALDLADGLVGGQGRMQAEFLAAEAPTLWLLTPWMFEGLELPPGSVDQLILKTLPFDHPNHAVISRRSQHYGDPFNAYSLPRLIHRVFRLFRTYARFRTENGSVRILDERLTTKSYGKTVREFLGHFAAAELPAPAAKPTAPKKKPAPKKEDKPGQMAMF
jgi:hypothetical protein